MCPGCVAVNRADDRSASWNPLLLCRRSKRLTSQSLCLQLTSFSRSQGDPKHLSMELLARCKSKALAQCTSHPFRLARTHKLTNLVLCSLHVSHHNPCPFLVSSPHLFLLSIISQRLDLSLRPHRSRTWINHLIPPHCYLLSALCSRQRHIPPQFTLTTNRTRSLVCTLHVIMYSPYSISLPLALLPMFDFLAFHFITSAIAVADNPSQL